MSHTLILQVAVSCPLKKTLDYLPPAGVIYAVPLGVRVCVPLGKRQVVGVLMGCTTRTGVEQSKLKHALSIIDEQPIIPAELLQLGTWMAQYYHAAIGEVIALMLPTLLRQGRAMPEVEQAYLITQGGRDALSALQTGGHQDASTPSLTRQKVKQILLAALAADTKPLSIAALKQVHANPIKQLQVLQTWGYVDQLAITESRAAVPAPTQSLLLNEQQAAAVQQIIAHLGQFKPILLQGVTGSGKTEVYLNALSPVVRQGQQVLMLVPEIGLTPQLLQRFTQYLGFAPTVLHSQLTEVQRLKAWQQAQTAAVVLGTRSALFAPLPKLGLIILDEEHDASFRQTDGLRYSARDVALVYAKQRHIPIVLGSATPNLESLHHVTQARYLPLLLTERAGSAKPPVWSIIDLRRLPLVEGLSAPLFDAIEHTLQRDEQVVLFLNRRGFAPVLMCHQCGWYAQCSQCDTRMTWHKLDQRLVCHHCQRSSRTPERCPSCHSAELMHVGLGTQRIEAILEQTFPNYPIARLDRDNTTHKGSLENLLSGIREQHYRLIIGTQMIAKGHDFPNVTLVGIIDSDGLLFSSDFRAEERLAQLLIQVGGRAGRAHKAGRVLIQTHHPEHPLFAQLPYSGYAEYAQSLLQERHSASLPPFSYQAIIRAQSRHAQRALTFLNVIAERLSKASEVIVYPALPAPMEKRGGEYRAQLLLQSHQRASLHRLLTEQLPTFNAIPAHKGVRWYCEVDPVTLF